MPRSGVVLGETGRGAEPAERRRLRDVLFVVLADDVSDDAVVDLGEIVVEGVLGEVAGDEQEVVGRLGEGHERLDVHD